jgi:hypothetical protein
LWCRGRRWKRPASHRGAPDWRRRWWRWRRRRWRWCRNERHPIRQVRQRRRGQRRTNPQRRPEYYAACSNHPDAGSSTFRSQIPQLHSPQQIVRQTTHQAQQHLDGNTEIRLRSPIVLRLPEIRFDFAPARFPERVRHAARVERCPQTHEGECKSQHGRQADASRRRTRRAADRSAAAASRATDSPAAVSR